MSAEAMNWAKRQKVGGPGPKAVLMTLADYADENHSCHPGQALLADITEQSERTVREQLAAMEKSGLFKREPRYRSEGRGRTSDRFYLAVDIPAKSAAMGRTNRRHGVGLTGTEGATNRHAVAAHRTASIDPRGVGIGASANGTQAPKDGLARLIPSGVQWEPYTDENGHELWRKVNS